jgi:hypothetical protein
MTPIVVDNWKDFAQIMIETKDLDPTYPIVRHLVRTHDRDWQGRFFLHYAWFYNIREAIRCADETDNQTFWARCFGDGRSGKKRGGARSRFRPPISDTTVSFMEKKFTSPADIIESWYRPNYGDMVRNIKANWTGSQMGEYYIWKLMDWFDICMDRPVKVTMADAVKYLPKVPKEAALDFFPDQTLEMTLSRILDHVGMLPHPVKEGKMCGMGEVETVICTLKGYLRTKSHWIGEDIADQHRLLADRPDILVSAPAKIPNGLYVRGEYRHVA